MNIGNGLKAIVNVAFWIWVIIGIILVSLGILGGKWNFAAIILALILGVGLPVIIRYVFFYIINSFK